MSAEELSAALKRNRDFQRARRARYQLAGLCYCGRQREDLTITRCARCVERESRSTTVDPEAVARRLERRQPNTVARTPREQALHECRDAWMLNQNCLLFGRWLAKRCETVTDQRLLTFRALRERYLNTPLREFLEWLKTETGEETVT